MKERPILFSGPMVQAILDGRKTQTRREVKAAPSYGCPYGDVGDRLWVRETFAPRDDNKVAVYRAGLLPGAAPCDIFGGAYPARWKPAIFMPRWASRITLEIVSVRYESLNQISGSDAMREGVERNTAGNYWVGEFSNCAALSAKKCFCNLWESINGAGTFDDRWVWVIEFKALKG